MIRFQDHGTPHAEFDGGQAPGVELSIVDGLVPRETRHFTTCGHACADSRCTYLCCGCCLARRIPEYRERCSICELRQVAP